MKKKLILALTIVSLCINSIGCSKTTTNDNTNSVIESTENIENINNEVTEECSVELIKNLCFLIEENDKKPLLYKIPIARKEYWERPYYFKIKKKDLINYIAKFSEKC